MDLIQRAYQTQLNDSTMTVMRKIFQIGHHNTTQDEDMESMLAFTGDKVLELALSSLVYKHRSTLNYQRQLSVVNQLANDSTALNKIADFIELEKVIQELNYNFDSNILTNQMLHRKLKAAMGIMAIHDSWDNLRDRINDWLSDHVETCITNQIDSGKSKNGPAKENETRLQLNRRPIQTINKDNEVEKIVQEFRRTSLGKYTREDDLKYPTFEGFRVDQSLYDESLQRQYELQNELSKRETINTSSPGNLAYKSQRHAVTPKEQRVFSAISGSTCTLQQFKLYVAELPDINARNSGKQGDTPLMLLLKKPQLREDDEIPKIQVLLGLGASWTATNNVGLDANAISQRHDPVVINKLKKTRALNTDDRVSFNETPDSYTVSPIMQKMFSGINGDTYTSHQFEEAVMQVPNVDARNSGKKGDTALMMLLRKETLDPQRDIPKIRILLKHGASWTATNNRGETAQQLITKHPIEMQGILESLRNLTESKSVNSENRSSPVMKNDSTPVRSITSQRIVSRNLNVRASSSNNSQQKILNNKELELINAIKTRNLTPNEFERLVTRVEEVNFCNEGELGDTPLMMMLRNKELNLIDIAKCKILVRFGASWDYQNKQGDSAIDLAALHDSKVIAEIKN